MCNGALFTVEKISPRAGIELGPLDQSAFNPLSYWAPQEILRTAICKIYIGLEEILMTALTLSKYSGTNFLYTHKY